MKNKIYKLSTPLVSIFFLAMRIILVVYFCLKHINFHQYNVFVHFDALKQNFDKNATSYRQSDDMSNQEQKNTMGIEGFKSSHLSHPKRAYCGVRIPTIAVSLLLVARSNSFGTKTGNNRSETHYTD